MSAHPFPETEPEIKVTPRPDSGLAEVVCKDAGGFFVPLEVGGEAKWSFYDWPERRLTNVSHTRVAGTIRYRGQDCLEIVDHIISGDDEGWIGRWLYLVSQEAVQIVLFDLHDGRGGGKIEEADVTPWPRRLRLGATREGHEEYRCGEEVRRYAEVQRAAVDGVFEVDLPAGDMLCLRETLWALALGGRGGFTLAELYVAENGRSVYFRRFNGPAYHNYDQLAGNPEREHEGVAWRLWYECLPDIALASDG